MEQHGQATQLPYPPIRITKQNKSYAQAMLDNMGGRVSEMSAVSLYFYNHLITEKFPEVAELFHKISVTEMRHLEIFGKLACALGGNPRLWSSKPNGRHYWSPSYNTYSLELPQLLKNAIQSEKQAIEKYQRQSERIKDSNVVENLQRIILDEMEHVELLTACYHSITKG